MDTLFLVQKVSAHYNKNKELQTNKQKTKQNKKKKKRELLFGSVQEYGCP
jgi:hypothetical protein